MSVNLPLAEIPLPGTAGVIPIQELPVTARRDPASGLAGSNHHAMAASNPHLSAPGMHGLGPYPLVMLGRQDAGEIVGFVRALDDRALAERFHRHMTAAMIDAHYGAVDWDNVTILAWIADGSIRGLAEALLYNIDGRTEAEIVVTVAAGSRSRGIGLRLVAAAAAEAARRGACRALMVLSPSDCASARIVRRLGGTVDWRRELAILTLC